ncbi:hypothetical protein HHK36_008101 [Tetracentron sinense]|uniref:Uncharacterized protein n=1 Tax=Tetracentron sinense TaxID=13715 RepID=A0A835DJQ6_TETSI|nr:hypothetical protein HHK36_008101 [Tetracentron sinense]
MNQIPVASRKYELVRSLTDKLIDENLSEGFEPLRQVNRSVLSAAFSRTLSQLEAAMLGQERERVDGAGGSGPLDYSMNRVLRAVLSFGDVARSRLGGAMEEVGGTVGSAEKLAAELLWLAQKLTGNGSAEEAVSRWGSASILASLSLSAEPRLQGSLVKITAFLFKQAKEMGEDECEKEKKEELMQRRMEMLMLWLPLLCRGSNGTDAPVLNRSERMEVEKSLEVNIEMLQQEEQQEKVLALWLHNFSTTPSSEWPNLHACYARWCDASRKLLLV